MPRAGRSHAGRQARRLLRDRDAAVPAADPAGGPARDDGVGLRRRAKSASPKGLLHPQRALAHDRGAVRTGRCGSSGSTSSRTRTATTCRTCCRSTRRCTGPTRRAARRAATRGRRSPRRPGRYTGPVPIVTHVHGAVGVGDESDGYAEAWYLPRRATSRRLRDRRHLVRLLRGQGRPKSAPPGGPASPRSSTRTPTAPRPIWYHDHTLGMTRLNVYAGPAGFYIVRGGPGRRQGGARQPHRHGGRASGPGAAARATSSRPTGRTTRSRSPSRTARSTPTGRSSIPTRGRSSTASRPGSRTSRTPTSRRSGTPSSSAT